MGFISTAAFIPQHVSNSIKLRNYRAISRVNFLSLFIIFPLLPFVCTTSITTAIITIFLVLFLPLIFIIRYFSGPFLNLQLLTPWFPQRFHKYLACPHLLVTLYFSEVKGVIFFLQDDLNLIQGLTNTYMFLVNILDSLLCLLKLKILLEIITKAN